MKFAGERTPIHWFDFEGDWGWEMEDLGPGKLTSRGMEHAFQLGQTLKQMYDHKVNFGLHQQVSVFSTDYDRTVDTAKSLLLGIYAEQGTPTAVQSLCKCRQEHGVRSSRECIAECIGIDAKTVPDIPNVRVRDNSDPAFHQANICEGWEQWIHDLEASEKWKSAADDQFSTAEDQVVALAGSDQVKALKWPNGTCEGCEHVHDPKVNPIDLMEQVSTTHALFLT